MENKIQEFVLDAIQKKYPLAADTDIASFNYVSNGYIDSLGLVQFVIELEDEFGIEFTDEDLENPDFKVVGKLVAMIEKKVEEKA